MANNNADEPTIAAMGQACISFCSADNAAWLLKATLI
jgi:hypothetical protein